MRWLALIAALLFSSSAFASVTIANFNTSATEATEVARFDATYNQIDSQDAGHIVQVGTCPGAGCLFYWIGSAKGCLQNPIYMLLNYGNWCGFAVRTSKDLKNWSAPATLYGPPNSNTECSPSLAVISPGCWAPGIIFNASTGKWVIWAHDQGASPTNVMVLVCNQDANGGPAVGCTKQANPAGPTTNAGVVASTTLFLDDNGDGYLCFSSPNGVGGTIYIQKLNASFTDVVGSATTIGMGVAGANVEAPACFKKGATYYAMFGANCAYCNGTDSSYRSASTPLGVWSGITTISANSCFGQLAGVDKLTISAADIYLYHVDQWWGINAENQALANQYFDQLTFTGTAIDALTCKTSTTIAGLTEVPITAPNADQGDFSADFQLYCDISSTKWRLQTFVPTASFIPTLNVTVAQNTTGGSTDCTYANNACGQINGNLVIDLVTVDVSNNPSAPIVSATYTPSQITASLMNLAVPINQTVTPGNKYGWIERGTNTAFSYCFAYNDLNSYSSGVERQSVNSGSTWSTETNRSLRFWTSSPTAQVPFSGVAH